MPVPSFAEIQPYIDAGLVTARVHRDNADVVICNYTPACQYGRAWDDVTRQCRGLVLNTRTGEVLANPFPKFWNYQEHIQNGWPIPDEVPVISEKYDGSLGIFVNVDGEPVVATRGSFESEQAQWATAWWRKNMTRELVTTNDVTHLFEVIAPCSRVVVAYDFAGLVYLGSRVTATGDPVDCWDLFDGTSVRRAETIEPQDLETLAGMDIPNSEGFVCHYPRANVRLKLKFADYVRLHRIVTGLSEIAIWERLRDGKPMDDLIDRVPDEFFQFVSETQAKLRAAFGAIDREATVESCETRLWAQRKGFTLAANRKEIAQHVAEKKHRSLVFSMLDRKPYAHAIWNAIRPRGQSTFAHDVDA